MWLVLFVLESSSSLLKVLLFLMLFSPTLSPSRLREGRTAFLVRELSSESSLL